MNKEEIIAEILDNYFLVFASFEHPKDQGYCSGCLIMARQNIMRKSHPVVDYNENWHSLTELEPILKAHMRMTQ